MKKSIGTLFVAALAATLLAGCGGGGGGAAAVPPPPPPPPPPPVDQSVSGIWAGDALTTPEYFTSFEFTASGPFEVGVTPTRAMFSNGNAETRGNPDFYITGNNAWHILVGSSATATFETNPDTLSFWVRTENAGDVTDIQILDDGGALIQGVTPTDVYQEIMIARTAGETKIGSVVVTSTSGGDVVIDDLTYGYAETSNEIRCVIAETGEIACTLRDPVLGVTEGGVNGTLTVANSDEVSGSGLVYARLGQTLSDGSTIANMTVLSGTVVEDTSLDLVVDAAGQTSTVSMSYDADYDRASSLATVEAVYTTFTVFGNDSSLDIDAAGVMFGNVQNGCVLTGQVSIIDAAFNAYDVELDISNCGARNGISSGLGLTRDINAIDDRLIFRVFSNRVMIIGVATK